MLCGDIIAIVLYKVFIYNCVRQAYKDMTEVLISYELRTLSYLPGVSYQINGSACVS